MTSLSLGTGFFEDRSTGRFLFSRLNFFWAPRLAPAFLFLHIKALLVLW